MIEPTTGGIAGGLGGRLRDFDISNLNSPQIVREDSLNNTRSGVNDGHGSQSEEIDEPKVEVEEQKQIDDVYDVNAVKRNYELQSLRKNWVLDYTALMEMVD